MAEKQSGETGHCRSADRTSDYESMRFSLSRLARVPLGACFVAMTWLLIVTCHPAQETVPSEYELVVDLVDELSAAEIQREVSGIDLGTAPARRHLLSGWSWDETGRDGSSFVWSVGNSSALRFLLVAPRDLTIELKGRALGGSEGESRRVGVELNGSPLTEVRVGPGREVHVLEVPAERSRAGENVLEFHHPWAVPPSGPRSQRGRRPVAVAWESLRLRPTTENTESPSAERTEDDAQLTIPFGTEVSFFLPVPADSLLAWDELLVLGPDEGRLTVEIEEESGTARLLADVAAGLGSEVVPLTGSDVGTELIRLTLRAAPEDPRGRGRLELARPAIWSPMDSRAAGATASALEEPGASQHADRPNLLIYLVDTLRADHVGAYRRLAPSITPDLDAFAAEAVIFEDVVAQSPWTRPSVATIMTGMHPLAHGVTTLEDRLADEAITLAEILHRAGYQTAAFSANAHVSEATGLAQGFDHFVFTREMPRADALGKEAISWLDDHLAQHADAGPFLLYLHTIDPHAPYEPPLPYRRRFAPGASPAAGTLPHLRRIYGSSGEERRRLMEPIPDLYAGEVASADRSFGALISVLEDRELLDATLVVFLSDHGEEFDEHGHLGHGANLHRETTAIPWLLRLPGANPGSTRRIGTTAQQIDLLPTLLGALDLAIPATLPGVDLLRSPGNAPDPRPAYSHLDYDGRRGLSVVLGEWKAVEPLSRAFGPRPELYHRTRDPGETENLADEHPVRLGYLRTLIRRHLLVEEELHAEELDLDDETRKGLEALGYL